jgi:hypothetical protein
MDKEAMVIQPIFRVTQVVWYLLDILEIFLAFRLILKLIGADPGAGFTHFIYTATMPFAQPFANVFDGPQLSGGYFEWSTLIAMVVYWLAALAIVQILLMMRPVSTREAKQRLKAEE